LFLAGGLTYPVAQLEKQSLVERIGSAGDDRAVFAGLTITGRDRVTAAFPAHVALVRENFLDLFDPDELNVLRETLERVVTKLRNTA